MRIFIAVTLMIFISSCAGTNLYKGVNYGKYNAKSDFYTGNLDIKQDSTFEYSQRVPHSNNTCKGSWKIISNTMMLLNGKDIMNYEGADSLFFKKLDCKNDTVRFIKKNVIEFKGYTFRKIPN